ncbi:hypothetical protein ZOSMA_87G00410 [Zostera marina]|uniref:Uncharacterized protein n=1 Tax=Zostera marina TaxID=29655 RepID=A0A0K9NL05_ZOSMR|nr:hypothetical protein ZOSMA_87G00410 [Zostera marina]
MSCAVFFDLRPYGVEPDICEVGSRKITERELAAELKSRMEWNAGGMRERVTEARDEDVVISFVSDYGGWFRTPDELQWAGEVVDPMDHVMEARSAMLVDDGIGDGDVHGAEDRTPSSSGRIIEDEDLGGVTGPNRGSSSSSSSAYFDSV